MPTPVLVRLTPTHLVAARGAEELHRRPRAPDDLAGLRAETGRYATCKAAHGARPIGRALFHWLDGPDGWLARLLGTRPADLWLEFVDETDAGGFLDTPWELLTDAAGDHLATRRGLSFSVVRRYVTRTAPRPPSVYRPSVAFMAADPRDNDRPLEYEAEERAILEAIGVNQFDFLCEDTGNLAALVERILAETEGDAGVDIVHLSGHG
ncbi:MAG TPA: CHAT domain-containing protein, partial [Urbifossiella sp.]|nr:CHAT domain-containing protein [Urbifossiella sp.]